MVGGWVTHPPTYPLTNLPTYNPTLHLIVIVVVVGQKKEYRNTIKLCRNTLEWLFRNSNLVTKSS